LLGSLSGFVRALSHQPKRYRLYARLLPAPYARARLLLTALGARLLLSGHARGCCSALGAAGCCSLGAWLLCSRRAAAALLCGLGAAGCSLLWARLAAGCCSLVGPPLRFLLPCFQDSTMMFLIPSSPGFKLCSEPTNSFCQVSSLKTAASSDQRQPTT
jgi:hypothetical protein